MFKKIKGIGKKDGKTLDDSEKKKPAGVSFEAQEKDPRSEHRWVLMFVSCFNVSFFYGGGGLGLINTYIQMHSPRLLCAQLISFKKTHPLQHLSTPRTQLIQK